MVFDQLVNAPLYFGLGSGFETALRYLMENDLTSRPAGQYALRPGEEDVLKISEYLTRTPELCRPEAHRRFADIQMVISGAEIMGYAPRVLCREDGPYDEAKDLAFYQGETAALRLSSGYFAIFFPDDVHQPSQCLTGPEPVRKAIIKIRLN